MSIIKGIVCVIILLCSILYSDSFAAAPHTDAWSYTLTDTLDFRYGVAPTAAYLSGTMNYISEENPTTNYNGVNGKFGDTGTYEYQLLFFFEGLSNWIPNGANIIDASLFITNDGYGTGTYDATSRILVAAHRVFEPWDITTVTWNTPWNGAGLSDNTGSWDAAFAGTAPYPFDTNWGVFNEDTEGSILLRNDTITETNLRWPVGADSLLASAVAVGSELDRLVFGSDYTDITAYITEGGINTRHFVIPIVVTRIVHGYFQKGWEDGYGFLLRVEKTSGTAGYMTIVSHTATEATATTAFRPNLRVIYQYSVAGGSSSGSGNGTAIGRTMQGMN